MAVDKAIDFTEFDSKLTTVADAIRTAGGTTEPMSFPSGMVEAISQFKSATEPYVEETYDSSNELMSAVLHGHKNIRRYAFSHSFNLTSITIPDSVTKIGDSAFNFCSNLTSITIPNSVTKLENYAFAYSRLTSVILPSSLTSAGYYTFYYSSKLTSVTMPDSITTIGDYAFAYSGLTSVTIPGSVKNIEMQSFGYCKSLTSVTFNGTPSLIRSDAFYNCSALSTINVPWAQGAVSNAPWGATNATINYNYTGA